MAASRLLPLAIAGVVIVGAAAWLINDSAGDETPVAAQPEAESDRTMEPRGVEAGSFQNQPPPVQPAAEPQEPSPPTDGNAAGTAEAADASTAIPPAPPVSPGTTQAPTSQEEDALARSIDAATDAWSTHLKLDSVQKRGLRDVFEANALRQQELRQAVAEGDSQSDRLAMSQENREALLGDLQSVLTSTQLAEYERITGSNPDGQ